MIDDRKKFYKTEKWRQKRAHILRRDGYQDQLEKRAGRTVPADTVHHILPREQYPEYAFSDWNLISISDETHRELHTIYGNLSDLGEKLKQETARAQGIKLSIVTLVIGLPGTGKTTLVKQNLKDGLAYDLDYLAAAFRLSTPGKDNPTARKMANRMVTSFAINVRRFTQKAYVIRTAPRIEELEQIEPDRLIICTTLHKPEMLKGIEDVEEKKIRIAEAEEWARINNLEVIKL